MDDPDHSALSDPVPAVLVSLACSMDPKQRFLTVAEVAARWNVSTELVRSRIATGQLVAINVGTRKRPSYRVSPDEIDVYERRQCTSQPQPPAKKRRRPPDIRVKFF